MLTEILTWWARQMLDLLPERWQAGAADSAGALLVHPTATGGVLLRLRRHRREHDLGRFALDPAGLAGLRGLVARRRPARSIVVLPPEHLLERVVALPLAAERDWPAVMRFEMDRLTPFAAEDVFWSGEVTRRDRAQARLELRLSLVPRAPLLPLIGALREAGLVADALQVSTPDGGTRLIGLENAAPREAVVARRLVFAAGGLCGTLALAALVLPFILQSLALQRTERRMAELRPAVQQVEALRRADQQRAAGAGGVAAARLRTTDPLAVLAAVTAALPDDTSLTALSLEHGRLSLTGQSGGAARLIAALSASPRLRNPAFSAPVTRNEAGRFDLFSIRAEATP